MGKLIDLMGQRFGRLVVIGRGKGYVSPKGYKEPSWMCKCDCGNIIEVVGKSLRNGDTKSCGCYNKEFKFIDLTGKKFGRLMVLKKTDNRRQPNGTTNIYWECLCDCGNRVVVRGSNLRSGTSRSCGCYSHDLFLTHRKESTQTHGLSKTRLFKVWQSMRNRCRYIKNGDYNSYGGRGITVCDEWLNDFQAFHDWAMANGYDENAPKGQCTIDRIDVNGNYEPNNCRWITLKEQMRNKRNTLVYTINGETKTLLEWCEIYKMPPALVRRRVHYGKWAVEEALTISPMAKTEKRRHTTKHITK